MTLPTLVPRERVGLRFVGYALDYVGADGAYLGTIDHVGIEATDDEALAVARRRAAELGAVRSEVWRVKDGIRPVGEVTP